MMKKCRFCDFVCEKNKKTIFDDHVKVEHQGTVKLRRSDGTIKVVKRDERGDFVCPAHRARSPYPRHVFRHRWCFLEGTPGAVPASVETEMVGGGGAGTTRAGTTMDAMDAIMDAGINATTATTTTAATSTTGHGTMAPSNDDKCMDGYDAQWDGALLDEALLDEAQWDEEP